MSDYSGEIDAETERVNGADFNGTAWKSLHFLYIEEDGAVSLGEQTYHGGDGTSEDIMHRRTVALGIGTAGDWSVIDGARLKRDLADGGALAQLIDRYLAGHDVRWDGHNQRGRTTDEADAALDEIEKHLAGCVTGAVACDASTWLGAQTMTGRAILDAIEIDVEALEQAIVAVGTRLYGEAGAESYLTMGGPEAMADAIREAVVRAREEASEDTDDES